MLQRFRFHLLWLAASMVLFLLSFVLNEWLFGRAEFVRGINWIYLPAGMRLLCTLLFGGIGALGILLATGLASFLYYFPGDLGRATAGAASAAAAPYLAYLLAQYWCGLRPTLANLSARRLLCLIVLYSFINPLLFHLGSWLRGTAQDVLAGFAVMFIGDLLGSLLVMYTIKLLLGWLRPPPA